MEVLRGKSGQGRFMGRIALQLAFILLPFWGFQVGQNIEDDHDINISPVEMETRISTSNPVNQDIDKFESLLQEFKRNRTHILFENSGSIFDGVSSHLVRTSTGELSFRIRDLVLDGHLPIVVSRIYSSMGEESLTQIGKGWRLSYDEYVIREGDRFDLHLASGKVVHFLQAGNKIKQLDNQPTTYSLEEEISDTQVVVSSLVGLKKHFNLIDGIYRITSIEDRKGHQLIIHYRDGLLNRIENSDGISAEFSYDSQGRLNRVSDSLGREVHYSVDESGLLKEVIDRAGNPWYLKYNLRQLERIESADNQALLQASYDGQGRVDSLVDEDDLRYTVEYYGASTQLIDGLNHTTTFYFNDLGVTTTVKNGIGERHTLLLDEKNRVKEYRIDDETQATYTYDENGLIRSIQTPDRGRCHYEYDAFGQIVQIVWPGGHYYKLERNLDGDIINVSTDRGERCAFERDSDGNITTWEQEGDLVLRIAWDQQGRPIRILSPSGEWLDLDYSDKMMPTSLITDKETIQGRYNDLGLLETAESGSSELLRHMYDLKGCIESTIIGTLKTSTSITTKREATQYSIFLDGLLALNLAFDKAGNVVKLDQQERSYLMHYNQANQLISAEILNNLNAVGSSTNKAISDGKHGRKSGRLYPSPLDDDEILFPGWKLRVAGLINSNWAGLTFDDTTGSFQIVYPTVEENLWVKYLAQNGLLKWATVESSNEKLHKNDLASRIIEIKPPEFSSVSTLVIGDDCICFYDNFGDLDYCTSAYCQVYEFSFIPQIVPPEDPQPPPCEVFIDGGAHQYVIAGNSKSFTALSHLSNIYPFWTVYRNALPIYETTTRMQVFSYYFSTPGEYNIVAWKGVYCEPADVQVTAMKLDFTQVSCQNDNTSFTTLAAENKVHVKANLQPDSLDGTYNGMIEWIMTDDPNQPGNSGNYPNPQAVRGAELDLTVTAPQASNGRGFPLNYIVTARVTVNGLILTSNTRSIIQDVRDQIRQEYIDKSKNIKPSRSEFVSAQTYQNPGNFPISEVNTSDYPTWCIFKIASNLQAVRNYVECSLNGLGMSISSGYRNPIHNDPIPGAALESKHIYGKAADIRLYDFNQDGLRDYDDWIILSNGAYMQGATKVENFQDTPTWCHMEW